jgi:hypothetical protein
MRHGFPKDRIIECLKELADESFQRRVWLASSGPEVSSFDEAVCGLFDDSGLGRSLETQSPIFNAAIDKSLGELDSLVTEACGDFQNESPIYVIEPP